MPDDRTIGDEIRDAAASGDNDRIQAVMKAFWAQAATLGLETPLETHHEEKERHRPESVGDPVLDVTNNIVAYVAERNRAGDLHLTILAMEILQILKRHGFEPKR